MGSDGREKISKVTYLLAGAGAGAILGLLFAPKPGKELRTNIADTTHRSIDLAKSGINVVEQEAKHICKLGYEKTADLVEAGAGALWTQKERIAAIVDAGRRTY
jgi:gas vesicle protein